MEQKPESIPGIGKLPAPPAGTRPVSVMVEAASTTNASEAYDVLIIAHLLQSQDVNLWAQTLKRGLQRSAASSVVRAAITLVNDTYRREGRLLYPLDVMRAVPDFERIGRASKSLAPATLKELIAAQCPTWREDMNRAAVAQVDADRAKGVSADEAYARLRRTMDEIQRLTTQADQGGTSVIDAAPTAVHEYDLNMRDRGVHTHLNLLERHLGCFGFGDTSVLAAATSTGKSWNGLRACFAATLQTTAGQIVVGPNRMNYNHVDLTRPVVSAFFSPEMGERALLTRACAMACGIPFDGIRKGHERHGLSLEQETLMRQYAALSTYSSKYLLQRPGDLIGLRDHLTREIRNPAYAALNAAGIDLTGFVALSSVHVVGPEKFNEPVDIFAQAQHMGAKQVVIDSFYLISPKHEKSPAEGISETVTAVVREAAKTHVHYLLTAQLNREGAQSSSPKLSHIADSSALEKHPSNVVFLQIHGRDEERLEIKYTIMKSRNDECGEPEVYSHDLNNMTTVAAGIAVEEDSSQTGGPAVPQSLIRHLANQSSPQQFN